MEQYLQNAKEVLDAVRHAAEDFANASEEQRANTAVRNFLDQGRSVTWALEHLKGHMTDPSDWDAWWAETTIKLRKDDASRCFYNLRNPVVKEGHPVEIRSVWQLKGTFTLPPPDETRPDGAEVWVLDGAGNPFWKMSDGSLVPAGPVPGAQRWNTLAGLPATLRDEPLTTLMHRHVCNLEEIVAAAREHFGGAAE